MLREDSRCLLRARIALAPRPHLDFSYELAQLCKHKMRIGVLAVQCLDAFKSS